MSDDSAALEVIAEPWHRDRYAGTGSSSGLVGAETVPVCACACHRGRQLIGQEDSVFDPRNHSRSAHVTAHDSPGGQ